MKDKLFFVIVFVIALLCSKSTVAQDYPYDIAQYDFIKYDQNRFEFLGDSSQFERMFSKLDTLISKGKGQLSVVHIGASHVQADIYTGRMRKRMQTFYPGLNAGRGFVFPYKLTRTNTPGTYYTVYTGKWTTCRNVEYRKTCTLGLSGLAATTHDSKATLKIILRKEKDIHYICNRIKIFHETMPENFEVTLDNESLIKSKTTEQTLGYTLIELNTYIDTLKIKFVKTNPQQTEFTLFGINLETDDQGIIYNSFGVNGASSNSYIRCDYFVKHLKVYQPDFVILSLGINDVYGRHFDAALYEQNMETLIQWIRQAAPNAAILLDISNDNYLFRRKANPFTAQSEEVVKILVKKYNCGLWNFYEIMGGLSSSQIWYKNNLMARDRIHFTVQGYMLIGDLLFNAFLNSYDNHIAKNNKKMKALNNEGIKKLKN